MVARYGAWIVCLQNWFSRITAPTPSAQFGVVQALDSDTDKVFARVAEISARTITPHCPHVLVRKRASKMLHRYMIKIPALQYSPFEITLFLDSDTYVLDPAVLQYEHWDKLLGDALFGIVPYNKENHGADRAKNLLNEFPHLPLMQKYGNGGVLAVRKAGIHLLCDTWLKAYLHICEVHNRKRIFDEPALNLALQTDLASYTVWLPKAYNSRTVDEETKIAHFFGWHPDKKLEQMQKLYTERLV